MALSCTQCRRTIDVSGERPSFCPYCGHALGLPLFETTQFSESQPIRDADDATVDYPGTDFTTIKSPATFAARFPERIAGYRLIRKLGQGGMGSVYEAEEEASGRRVALKLISPEFAASTSAVERFLQEGRLAGTIAHPRCVFVHAADHDEGRPYIVMELMPGHTLRDVVQANGPLGQADAVHKIMDVIEGLEEAHKKGVIHRDVKPSNCFLDASGRVKIGDFGLSKQLVGSDLNLTQTGSFLGTPLYASPEQLKGEAIDGQSDVYSLAATLFFLLTGRPPFEGNDPTVTLARIVSDTPPTVRSIRPEIWETLDEVVLRGLDRDLKKRYRNLEEFRVALSPFLPGRVTLGRMGIRLLAYGIDFVICFVITSFILAAVELSRRSPKGAAGAPRAFGMDAELISGCVLFVYFLYFEVFHGVSIGKRVFGLRIASITRGRPRLRERLVRTLAFCLLTLVPGRLVTLGVISLHHRLLATLSLGTALQLLSYPLLFITARAKNGFRGLHELWSGTSVVQVRFGRRRLRKPARRKPESSEPSVHLLHPADLPTTVGTFEIEGALAWTDDLRILLGTDPGLGREVWIVLRPDGDEAIARARRDLGRIGRLRWINGGELESRRWDAFVAPGGRPLVDVVDSSGRFDWPEARLILEYVAAEAEAACEDGTFPERPALERVWIGEDGRILLIDEWLDPLGARSREISEVDPDARALELLRRIAVCAIGGAYPIPSNVPTPVGAPVPGHVFDVLERLCRFRPAFESVADFRTKFNQTREDVEQTTPFQRVGHAAYTFVSIIFKTWIVPALYMGWLISYAVMSKEKVVPIVSEETFDQLILIQSLFWVLMVSIFQDGVGELIFGQKLGRADGRPSGRIRLAWREALLWLPMIVIDRGFELIPLDWELSWYHLFGGLTFTALMPFLYVAPALFLRGRYLNDLLAKTAVVPK